MSFHHLPQRIQTVAAEEWPVNSDRVAGLVFAIYEDNGMTAGLEVSPFFIEKHPETPGIPPQPYRTNCLSGILSQHLEPDL